MDKNIQFKYIFLFLQQDPSSNSEKRNGKTYPLRKKSSWRSSNLFRKSSTSVQSRKSLNYDWLHLRRNHLIWIEINQPYIHYVDTIPVYAIPISKKGVISKIAM